MFAIARSISNLTPSALRQHLISHPVPLHLPNLITSSTPSWPALDRWRLNDGLDALRNAVDPDRVVEVEMGKPHRGYLDPDHQRISMAFGTFLDAFILGKIPSATPSGQLPTAYLAQMGLNDYPRVMDDVPDLPHFQSGPQGSTYRRTLWVGPGRSFTPFHRDPYIGIYSQIVGRKSFNILPPAAKALLDPSTNPLQGNTSIIPISIARIFADTSDSSNSSADDPPPDEIQRYRKQLKEAFELPGACQVDLAAGESVLVPEGWFHSAEGIGGPGVGVGAWFR